MTNLLFNDFTDILTKRLTQDPWPTTNTRLAEHITAARRGAYARQKEREERREREEKEVLDSLRYEDFGA